MTGVADVTAAAEAYAAARYDQGKADQSAADQVSIADLRAQVNAALAADATDKQKTADVQAAFDAYVSTHHTQDAPPPPPPTRFPGDPGLGNVYVGESRGGGDPTDREKVWGATVGVFRSYRLWGEWDKAIQVMQRDHAAGRLPIVSMHTGSLGWASVASGAHDTEIKAFFARVAALAKPVWFAWDHEPVDNPEQGTPAEFGAMNTHTMSLLPKNMALTPIVQSYPFDPAQNPHAVSVAPWYPPGSYTFVGVDVYNGHWYFPTPGGPNYRDATSVLTFITKVRKDLGQPDVPVVICETGVRTDPANPGKAAGFLQDLVAQAKTMNIPAISYFDSGTNVFTGTSFALDDMGDGTKNTERLDAYGKLVAAGAHLKATP